MSDLESVEYASMLPGCIPIQERSVNTVWKGPVMLSDRQEVIAYVKVIPNRDLFIECACALLGRQIGLKIPPSNCATGRFCTE